MASIVWKPQLQQSRFMARPEYEVLFGGAAGGGKSDALLCEALRQVHIPHYRAIIFRKTYPQLSSLINRSMALYKRAFPKARYNATQHCWIFPSGARLYFGSMPNKASYQNYQGQQYDFIGFDELTHFTWEEYSYLFSRNRPSAPPGAKLTTRCYIRATANPGGIGHGWVKERFIDAAEPGRTIWEEIEIDKPDGTKVTVRRNRVFIPSSVFDNQELLRINPGYLESLSMLPEKEKRALLYGDWNSFEGQYFTEFRAAVDMGQARAAGCTESMEELLEQRRFTHVIEPFDLSKGECRGWNIFRSYDFGYNKPYSLAYWAQDYDGVLYRFLEVYGCNGTPNQGVLQNPHQQFEAIAELERTHPWLKGRTITDSIADPSIFDKSRGESTAEVAAKFGIYFTPGDNHRIPGWMQVHYRLQFDQNGYPRMYIFKGCKAFIRTIPLMMYSPTRPEDLDTSLEDHVADEVRYLCMSRPIEPRRPVVTQTIAVDPLKR